MSSRHWLDGGYSRSEVGEDKPEPVDRINQCPGRGKFLSDLLEAVHEGARTGTYIKARDLLRLRELIERPLPRAEIDETIPEWIRKL